MVKSPRKGHDKNTLQSDHHNDEPLFPNGYEENSKNGCSGAQIASGAISSS
ncbi:hypothetical protein KIN20_006996 [Parelaphostrongylus tenuis]|uniref:Uncharacterized protein n=1 Tax=Parelaphostrongylus tenuis TaxID=148309 RepID=A0AAD5MUV8_PARTN|nr:hypothetical protein KIN20_006996 [Parelaphostrongylus tenuis]